jgi:hypothetical protein
MKKLALLFFVFASSAALAQDQPQATTATISFYRPHRFEGAALKPPILVDEVEVAHLHNGDAVQVTVNPGTHQIHSNDKSTGIELDAKAGQTYFVRVDIKAGAWKGHGQITLIDPQEGKFEFSKQKVSVTKDLSTNQAAAPAAEPAKAPAAATPAAAPTTGAQMQNPSMQNPPARNPPAQNSTALVQTTDQQQQPSLGDVARQYRDKKAKPQTQQQDQPQN